MRRTLRKYALIYLEFLRSAMAAATSVQLHFALVIFMDLLFYASSIGTAEVLYGHIDAIGPWRREQFLFFVAFMLAIDQIHMVFISENFWIFSYELRTGRFDFTLTKPVAAPFVAFLRYVRAPCLLNFPVVWAVLIHYGRAADLTPLGWVLVPFMVLLALTLQVSIEIVVTTTMFLTIESFGINFVRLQLQQLSRWPDFIFRGGARVFFTLGIPVLLIGSPPVRAVFDTGEIINLWPLAVALLGTWAVAWVFWRVGLRTYESASS